MYQRFHHSELSINSTALFPYNAVERVKLAAQPFTLNRKRCCYCWHMLKIAYSKASQCSVSSMVQRIWPIASFLSGVYLRLLRFFRCSFSSFLFSFPFPSIRENWGCFLNLCLRLLRRCRRLIGSAASSHGLRSEFLCKHALTSSVTCVDSWQRSGILTAQDSN